MNYGVRNPAVSYAFHTGPNEPSVTRVGPCMGKGIKGKNEDRQRQVRRRLDRCCGIPKEIMLAYGHSCVVKKQDAMVNSTGSRSSSSVLSLSLSLSFIIIDNANVSLFLRMLLLGTDIQAGILAARACTASDVDHSVVGKSSAQYAT
ncbi:hypothetical protein K435DRAFT_962312, partial [Dendrothele bispora CBS 962.96]